MTDFPKIGFVGLGNMGGPMCLRLLAAGYPVPAFDLNPEAMARATAAGARAASSAADCAAGSHIFLTSLPRPDHVETVMAGEQGALARLKKDSLWIDLTTNRKEMVEAFAAQAPSGVSLPLRAISPVPKRSCGIWVWSFTVARLAPAMLSNLSPTSFGSSMPLRLARALRRGLPMGSSWGRSGMQSRTRSATALLCAMTRRRSLQGITTPVFRWTSA